MKRFMPGVDLSIFAPLLAAGLTVSSESRAQPGAGYYHGHMWDAVWHGWFFGPLMMILLVGLIVVGVVLLVRRGDEQASSTDQSCGETSLDILEKRFARGEIDKNEFEERRRTLTK